MKKDKFTVEELLSRLALHSDRDEHEGVLDCATRILAQKSDQDVQRLRSTALIKLDKFKDALSDFEKDETLKQKLPIHYAYTLYKLGRYDDIDEHQNGNSRAVQHILAQSAYKKNEITKTQNLYNNLLNESPSEVENEDFDLQVNISAVLAQQALLNSNGGQDQSVDLSPDYESYDQTFNAAIVRIAQQDYKDALEILSQAKLACENSEGMSPEEVASELAPILVQAAFVEQLQGNTDQAKSILQNVEPISDPAVKQVAENNKVAMDAADLKNPHVALAQIDQAGDSELLNQSQTRIQTGIIGYNRLILQYLSGRNIRSQSKKFVKSHPEIGGPSALAALANGTDKNELIKEFKNTSSLGSAFALAQVYSQEKNFDAAAGIIESLHSKLEGAQKYAPGLVSVLVSLYKLQHRETAISKLLSEALDQWSSSNNFIANQRLIQMASSVLIGSKDDALRTKAEEQFVKLAKFSGEESGSSITNTAGLVAGGAKDKSYEAKLPSIDSLLSRIQVDVAKLDEDGIHPLIGKRKFVAPSGASKSGPKKKAKTNKRLPKDYDPSKQPDPERWLPKRDRSTWKPKRKDKKAAKNSTQGGTADGSTESGIQQSTSTTVKSSSSNNKKKNKKKGKK